MQRVEPASLDQLLHPTIDHVERNPPFHYQDVGVHSVGNGEERINAIHKLRG